MPRELWKKGGGNVIRTYWICKNIQIHEFACFSNGTADHSPIHKQNLFSAFL